MSMQVTKAHKETYFFDVTKVNRTSSMRTYVAQCNHMRAISKQSNFFAVNKTLSPNLLPAGAVGIPPFLSVAFIVRLSHKDENGAQNKKSSCCKD